MPMSVAVVIVSDSAVQTISSAFPELDCARFNGESAPIQRPSNGVLYRRTAHRITRNFSVDVAKLKQSVLVLSMYAVGIHIVYMTVVSIERRNFDIRLPVRNPLSDADELTDIMTFKGGVTSDDSGLRTYSRGYLRPDGPRMEIFVVIGGAQLCRRPDNAHLTLTQLPVHRQRTMRLLYQLSALSAVVIGKEAERTAVAVSRRRHAFE